MKIFVLCNWARNLKAQFSRVPLNLTGDTQIRLELSYQNYTRTKLEYGSPINSLRILGCYVVFPNSNLLV